jgi:hypothetical protein
MCTNGKNKIKHLFERSLETFGIFVLTNRHSVAFQKTEMLDYWAVNPLKIKRAVVFRIKL